MQNEHIKVGKLDINYLTGGQGDPLVVIHGGGGHGARAWLENAIELSRYYRVYVPDLPGLGHSQPISDDFHVLEFVEFVKGFSNKLGLKCFHLLGHSIGGAIVLHYALRFPHEVKSLILVNSMCLGREIALWVRLVSSLIFCLGEAALIVLKALAWLIRLFFAPFEFATPLPRFRIGLGKSITTLGGQTSVLVNRLSELIMPTLLVWGARDGIIPTSHAYTAAKLIPHCQLCVFEDCGHSVYRQKVHEFSQLLIGFLNKGRLRLDNTKICQTDSVSQKVEADLD